MILSLLIIVAGFALLIKSADFLVDGSSSVAKKFGISSLVIGLTIVAFGTSAPELVINIISSAQGANEIAIGNILGSNIANTLLILGVAAIISTLYAKKSTTWKEIPLSLLAVVILALLANDQLIDGGSSSVLSRIDGLVMLAFFIIFIYYTFGIAKIKNDEDTSKVKTYTGWLSALMIIGGLAGLTIGGKLVVDNAVKIASHWGVSEALIGLTIVALGSSLPELVTAAVAARKGQSDIAIGNVVGSNIFNIFWILGISATIRPLIFTPGLNLDVIILLAITVILFAFMLLGERHVLKRWHGISFVAFYVLYVLFLIFRG